MILLQERFCIVKFQLILFGKITSLAEESKERVSQVIQESNKIM